MRALRGRVAREPGRRVLGVPSQTVDASLRRTTGDCRRDVVSDHDELIGALGGTWLERCLPS